MLQVDTAKVFDKVRRGALLEFVDKVAHPSAPHAAAYITSMYTKGKVEVKH